MPKRTKRPEVIIPDPPLDVAIVETREAMARDESEPITCPVCGTAKTANRCDVCGHQEHDT